MTLEDFTYWEQCWECCEAMDESEAYQCQYCEEWLCRKCYKHHEAECPCHDQEE